MRLLIVVVSGLVLAGCSPAEGPTGSPSVSVEPSPTVEPTTLAPPSPSPAVESVSPTPVPTEFQSYPADLPTEDPESAAIIEGWQEYQRVSEKFASDPTGYTDAEFNEILDVSWGEELLMLPNRMEALRENNVEFVGGTQFRDLSVDERGTDPEGHATAVLNYCVDTNHIQMRNTSTGELTQGSGTFRERAQMVQGPDGIWRVAQLSEESGEC